MGYTTRPSTSSGRTELLSGSLEKLKPLFVEEGYVESRFRESRDKAGKLTYLSGDARLREIREMSLHDVEAAKICSIAKLFYL